MSHQQSGRSVRGCSGASGISLNNNGLSNTDRDSDIGKWLEGACYFLHTDYDAEVDAAVQELTDMLSNAQHDDGYLNLHYSIVEPTSNRFTNIRDFCELYVLVKVPLIPATSLTPAAATTQVIFLKAP